MAREQGKVRSAAEYACVLCLYALFAYLPLPLVRLFAALAADVWRALDRRHEAIAVEQMIARLGVDRDEAKRLARANYRHHCLLALELCRLNRMPLAEVAERTDFAAAAAIIRGLLAEGKGLVAITGHIGNWEWGCVAMGAWGLVTGALARPMDNPLLDRALNRMRERSGMKVWSKFGGIRNALATLREGNAFVAVTDQDGGHDGVPARFLGKVGSTMAVPVDLAIRTGAPIIVSGVIRDGEPLRYAVPPLRVLRPRPGAETEAERMRLLGEMNDALGDLIRRHPEQWIWTHRRWRTEYYNIPRYNTPEWRRDYLPGE